VADGVLTVTLAGAWRLTEAHPEWSAVVAAAQADGAAQPHTVRIVAEAIEEWDSSLPLFVREARKGAEAVGANFEARGLPAGAEQLERTLAAEATKAPPAPAPAPLPDLFTAVGNVVNGLGGEWREFSRLVGECSFSIARFFRGQAQFRWRDCLLEMQLSGGQALPIVGVIAVLTGVILAYQAAAQLRQFGADIFVADMVGIAMVREMGPLMTAVVLSGRTGAAFAATLGSMKANEEIDALQTLGVSPVDFLVMPRILALCSMLPLLVLFANALGIVGGLIIALGILDIPANLYWTETKSFVDLSDLFTGLIKAATYGTLIGLSGCLRGMQAERSAGGVGQAATSAVVTSIFLIIVANAIFAVLFNILGW
jgi:phospholipid/cholesterol/gamma-HCH transport system permease protein